MFFGPNQLPRAVLPREFSANFVGPVVTGDPVSEIIRVANIETTSGILKDVHGKHLNLAPAVGFGGSFPVCAAIETRFT